MKRGMAGCRLSPTCRGDWSAGLAAADAMAVGRGEAPSAVRIVRMRKLLLAVAVLAAACAPKVIAPPVVAAPRFPEFIRPATPPGDANSAAAINADRGWAFLQTGDLKTAEHEFAAALRNDPRFYPAEASLGYVELARKDPKAALPHFDRALDAHATDVS